MTDIDGNYPYWIEEQIRNTDTDQFGHVNNTAIAAYCEAGRMGIFADASTTSIGSDFSVVVARLLIEFKQELFYPGRVRVGTRVVSMANSSFTLTQSIFGPDGIAATSEAVCVLLSRQTRRPTRLPDKLRNAWQVVGSR